MNLIKEKASHWYRVENDTCSPCHEWPKKDGSGMKRTTLREAKAYRLLPSVTNIIDGVIHKPELERWKITQALMAALTLPRIPGEAEDAFAARVTEDMDAYSEDARDFGTLCHDHIDHYITHGEVLENEAEPYTRHAREWIIENINEVYRTEATVFHPELGYAGRLDIHCGTRTHGRAIVDFKSQKVRKKPNGEFNPVFYDEFGLQLAAYAECVRFQTGIGGIVQDLPTLISIIINSDAPSQAFVKIYDNAEFLLRLFRHTLDLWCWKKGYDPRCPA